MKVTYIYHSCFVVELEHTILIFDYYKGTLPDFDPHKQVYVFVSHRHPDHYSSRIFNIQHPNITYILSNDIHSKRKHVYKIGSHESLHVDAIHISTLCSTDEGVAFLVKVEDITIYHAGDLNWWDWGNEDSEEESKWMKDTYFNELKLLKGTHIDVAFLPLDARLQERYDKGILAFLQEEDVDVVFPMHFWDEIDIVKRLFEEHVKDEKMTRMKRIEYQNQSFLL